jgi:hypothetical protein
MDFGGHDSDFHDNVVVARNGQNCIGTASFVAGHADRYFNNSCVVYGTERVDDLFENCNEPGPGQAMLVGFNNRYYTAVGAGPCGGGGAAAWAPLTRPPVVQAANASATCDCCGLRPLRELGPACDVARTLRHPAPFSAECTLHER